MSNNWEILCVSTSSLFAGIGLFGRPWHIGMSIIAGIIYFGISLFAPGFWHRIEGGGGTDVGFAHRIGHVLGQEYACGFWGLVAASYVSNLKTWYKDPKEEYVLGRKLFTRDKLLLFFYLLLVIVNTLLLQLLNLSTETPWNAIASTILAASLWGISAGVILYGMRKDFSVASFVSMRSTVLLWIWANMTVVFNIFYFLWFFISGSDTYYLSSETGFQLYAGLLLTTVFIPAFMFFRKRHYGSCWKMLRDTDTL